MTPKRPGISEPPYWKAPWARYYAWLCLSLQGHPGISEGPFHIVAEDNCFQLVSPWFSLWPTELMSSPAWHRGSLWNNLRRVTQIHKWMRIVPPRVCLASRLYSSQPSQFSDSQVWFFPNLPWGRTNGLILDEELGEGPALENARNISSLQKQNTNKQKPREKKSISVS